MARSTPSLTEVFRFVVREADFPWHKFPPIDRGGPSDGGNPDLFGSKRRDVSKVGPASSNTGKGSDGTEHAPVDYKTFKGLEPDAAQYFQDDEIQDNLEPGPVVFVQHDGIWYYLVKHGSSTTGQKEGYTAGEWDDTGMGDGNWLEVDPSHESEIRKKFNL